MWDLTAMKGAVDILTSWILSNYPSLALVIVAAFTVWKIRAYYDKQKYFNNKVKALPCDRHREEMALTRSGINELILATGNLNASLSEVGGRVSGIEGRLIDVSRWIIKKDSRMTDTLFTKNSPYIITPIGYSVLELSTATKVLNENLELFLGQLTEINPTTAYDVENESLSVILRNTEQSFFKSVKDYLYMAPDPIIVADPDTGEHVQLSIDITQIARLMSLQLRDEYLHRHPEIDPMKDAMEI